MTNETVLEYLKRKHPRLYKRVRANMLAMFGMGLYGGFVLGLVSPSIWQNITSSIAALDSFLTANPLVGMLIGGFTLGVNFGCYLSFKLRRRER